MCYLFLGIFSSFKNPSYTFSTHHRSLSWEWPPCLRLLLNWSQWEAPTGDGRVEKRARVFVPKSPAYEVLELATPSSGKHRSWQAPPSTHSPSLRLRECSHPLPFASSDTTQWDTTCLCCFPSSCLHCGNNPLNKFPSDYLLSVIDVSCWGTHWW